MSDSTTANKSLDYSLLLVTHIVCADRQIHSEQLKALHQLVRKAKAEQRTNEEIEKILTQDEHLISVDVVAQGVPQKRRARTLREILVIAHIDGFYSPLEQEMVERVAAIWNWSLEEIQHLCTKTEVFVRSKLKARAAAQSRKDNCNRPKNSLWDDPDYKSAVRRCAEIAREDYGFTESALQAARTTLDDLKTGIQHRLEAIQNQTSKNTREETTNKEVAQQLEATKQSLENEIDYRIKIVQKSLYSKQHALNHFSIAFMGKTKAGKSTLHAIMTGKGWDAIGVGKQRTTRLNRVYEWENIRIIDTPGIGAPGGKSDEEIAQSVIPQSDVICYVVTNDSIQETEFNFLRLLKENAKPLIILLNVKYNLRDSRRLEHFLENPGKLFAIDGKSGLGGHIERIRRYAKQHYANDYFEIVPVMLLAAQLDQEPEHQHHKDRLFEASRIQQFLDEIWLSLVDHGAIRRSQTLLGSTVGDIENPCQWVKQQTQTYTNLTDLLKNKREIIQKDIKKAENDILEFLNYQVEAIFNDALNSIPSFAEEHWASNEAAMKQGWEQKLSDIRLDARLRAAYEEAIKTFNKEVQENLEEIGRELQLIAQVSGGTGFGYDKQDSDDFWRHAFRIGGGIIGVIGAVMLAFGNPIGGGLVIVGGLVNLLSNFFKSKFEKRKEAVEKISKSLNKQLKDKQKDTLKNVREGFKKHCESVASRVDLYFKELIEGLDAIAQQLESARSKLEQTVNDLNRAYAKRIIDWCLKDYEPLIKEKIDSAITEVIRDFGRSMSIQTKSGIELGKSQDDIKRVLQEDISIQANQTYS